MTAPAPKPKKVTRVGRACDQCNRKRTKCDGKNPCKHCQDLNIACEYFREQKKRGRASAAYPKKVVRRKKAGKLAVPPTAPQHTPLDSVALPDPTSSFVFPQLTADGTNSALSSVPSSVPSSTPISAATSVSTSAVTSAVTSAASSITSSPQLRGLHVPTPLPLDIPLSDSALPRTPTSGTHTPFSPTSVFFDSDLAREDMFDLFLHPSFTNSVCSALGSAIPSAVPSAIPSATQSAVSSGIQSVASSAGPSAVNLSNLQTEKQDPMAFVDYFASFEDYNYVDNIREFGCMSSDLMLGSANFGTNTNPSYAHLESLKDKYEMFLSTHE